MKHNPQNSEILSENEKNSIKEMIENAITFNEKFPVNFNDFWQWLGYFRKQKALTFLHNNFIKNLDFLPDFLPTKTQNGRPQKLIKLTLDCAINFAKISNTKKSNLVYDFILICKGNFDKKSKIYDSKVNYANKALINLQQKDGKYVVSARELHNFLGFDSSNWVKYYKVNITENSFAVENVDFTSLVLSTSENSKGNFGLDFLITIDFAKKLAMQARTEKGEEARNYFLKCEKDLLEVAKKSTFQPIQEVQHKDTNDKLDIFAELMTKNTAILEKMCDVQIKLLGKSENNNERIELLENECAELKNRVLFLEKNIPQKRIFVLIVIFDKENNYHRIFTKENPVFYTENEKFYFEQSEVLFSMEFEQKSECKKTEKYILGLLKLQKAHIQDDYFELKPNHFQIFEGLKVI